MEVVRGNQQREIERVAQLERDVIALRSETQRLEDELKAIREHRDALRRELTENKQRQAKAESDARAAALAAQRQLDRAEKAAKASVAALQRQLGEVQNAAKVAADGAEKRLAEVEAAAQERFLAAERASQQRVAEIEAAALAREQRGQSELEQTVRALAETQKKLVAANTQLRKVTTERDTGRTNLESLGVELHAVRQAMQAAISDWQGTRAELVATTATWRSRAERAEARLVDEAKKLLAAEDARRKAQQELERVSVAAREAARNRDAYEVHLAPGVALEFVRVPAADFKMGSDIVSDPQAGADETPENLVAVHDYLIGKYPITVAQFAAFVQATQYRIATQIIIAGKEKHPVTGVSWDEALAFCVWVSKLAEREIRLPTEAEWEKAARGDDGRLYPWGNAAPNASLLNYGNNIGDTTPVDCYPSGLSPFGALDMAGNVWEWTLSLYRPYPYVASDGREEHAPRYRRVLRGGSFCDDARDVRCAFRNMGDPFYRQPYIGFRVAVPCP